jgi:GTP-binding protein
MKFLDQAKIYIKAGNGGSGSASFRREKFIEYGGPDGGNGGKGGDVIFKGNKSVNTLQKYRFNQHHYAKNGSGGSGKLKTGASGKDLILEVPCGTEIYNEDMTIKVSEILEDGQLYYFLRGGQGGKGNTHFKSASNRAPRKVQDGEIGQEVTVRLKLKLLADVGLVGMPNAGKSSILSVVTNATPKVADYPFTTLDPHIGMVQTLDQEFIMADIPGIIEEASLGKGLGHDFLAHVERCSILIHVLDCSEQNVMQNYEIIRNELKNYGKGIEEKLEIIVLNKTDIVDEKKMSDLKQAFENATKQKVFEISAATSYNLSSVTKYILELMRR